MSRRTLVILSCVLFLCAPSVVRGEEVADQWIKYFDGDWKRDSKLWTANDGWTEETETWTGELVAGGITNVSKGTSSWGDFMTVFAIEGHSGKLFEYGSAANGNRWRIEFTTVKADKLVGKLLAATGGGAKGEGELTLIKTGDDAYEAEWVLKLDNGTEMKGSAKNMRK